jgi:hypothetical protein
MRRNPKVHYLHHNGSHLTLCKAVWIQPTLSHNIRVNSILPYSPRSPSLSLAFPISSWSAEWISQVSWPWLISLPWIWVLMCIRHSNRNRPVSSTVWPSKMLLALASTVVLGLGPRRDPWPYFRFFQTFTCFGIGPPSTRGEVRLLVTPLLLRTDTELWFAQLFIFISSHYLYTCRAFIESRQLMFFSVIVVIIILSLSVS